MYFSTDYFEARTRFRTAAINAGGRLASLGIGARGPGGEDLSIDIAWFGSARPRRVLLHSSGIHGVEGFAGSAIQLRLIEQLPALPADSALVVVHVLNPYGMAWLRRVNENNVDLNRNFRAPGTFDGSPPAYPQLDAFLNPASPPAADFYLLKALLLITRHGLSGLKQSVASGQYDYPRGLFFGGSGVEESADAYETFLTHRLSAAEYVVAIDVHTGLGSFGEDVLLAEAKDYELLREIYGPRTKSLQPQSGPAYRVEGGLHSMLLRVFDATRPHCIGQEFGTYSALRVLHALREENRWHHFGGRGLDHDAKRNLREAFCPSDSAWQAKVLRRGGELIAAALAQLARRG